MPPLLQNLISSLPSILVSVAGLVLAMVMLQRRGPAALMAAGGCLLVLVNDGMVIAFQYVAQRLIDMQVPQNKLDVISMFYFLAADLVLGLGVALLLAGALVGRRQAVGHGSPPHPQHPYQGQQPTYQGQPPYQGPPPNPEVR